MTLVNCTVVSMSNKVVHPWKILQVGDYNAISCLEFQKSLRLRVHIYGMSQTCPYDFFKSQYSGFPTRTSDRTSQWFPMNNIRVESSLVRLQRVRISHLRAKRASNGSCCCWKFLHQFARPDAH